MWKDCRELTSSTRMAMAGSIYMRKASLQVEKGNSSILHSSNKKEQGVGKIVKNSQKQREALFEKSQNFCGQASHFRNCRRQPFSEKINMIIEPQRSQQLCQNSFMRNFVDSENTKIKMMEDKYRKVLSNYEEKRKAIDNELHQLRYKKKGGGDRQLVDRTPHTTRIRSNSQQLSARNQNLFSSENSNKCIGQFSTELDNSVLKNQKTKVNSKQKVKDQFPEFFNSIEVQMKLEEELRSEKLKVPAENKNQVIELLMNHYGISEKNFLEVSEEEQDPFLFQTETKDSSQNYAKRIVDLHKKCEQNWETRVSVLDQHSAKNIFRVLNFERNRQINLRAFIRQMGLILEKHCRSRDLFKIYKRLEPMTENNFVVQTNRKK